MSLLFLWFEEYIVHDMKLPLWILFIVI